MGGSSPTGINNFGNGVCGWRNLLEGDSEDTKQQNLDGGTRSIPVCLNFEQRVVLDGVTNRIGCQNEQR